MKKRIISGIMVTLFLVTMLTVAFPVRVSAPPGPPVVIGLIGPKGWIQWDGIKEGAELARDLINNAPANDKGMWDGSQYRPVQLVEIDEHAVPVPDPTAAIADLLAALDANPDMKILVGGFSESVVWPLREATMDYVAENGRPVWIICGASDDNLVDAGPVKDNPRGDVRRDYERYKYLFRTDPMNATTLGNQLFYMMGQLIVPKLSVLFTGGGPVPTYLIGEVGHWCDLVFEIIQENAANLGITIVGVGRPSTIETDFTPFLGAIVGSGAKLIIHVFAAVAGATFIKQWGDWKVSAVPVGINVESQMQEFYASVGGKCEYETILSALGTRSNINPNAKPLSTTEFWDTYSAEYGHAPIYTAWGGYLELLLLNRTAADWIGKTCDEIVPIFERTEVDTLLGHFKYTKYHELYCDAFAMTPIWPPAGWPSVPTGIGTVRAHIPQWQAGRLEVVWPRGYKPAPGSAAPPAIQDPTPLPFAGKWKIPPWMYSLTETDFAGGPLIPSPPIAVGSTPAGFFGYFTSPDGSVGPADMGAVTGLWQQTCVWTLLEADMDGNQYIDIDDVARVALDWGKTP